MATKAAPQVKSKRKIFPGWYMAAGGTVLVGYGYGTWYYGFGNIFTPLAKEFGWSRASTALAFSFARFEGGLEGLIVGPLIDKLGPRKILLIGWIVSAAGFFMLSMTNDLLWFYLAYSGLLSLGMNMGLYQPMSAGISNWFIKKRGLALGILTSGSAVGSIILLPLVAAGIEIWGWRQATFAMGVGALLLGIPLAFVFKDKRPEHYGLLPDGAPIAPEKVDTSSVKELGSIYAQEEEFSIKQALKTQAFWVLTLSAVFTNASLISVVAHQMPLMQDRGIAPVTAAFLAGLMNLSQTPGKLGGGALADRLPTKYLLAVSVVFQAAGTLVLAVANNIPMFLAYALIFGLGFGAGVPVRQALRGQYWGRKAFATIGGIQGALTVAVGVSAPFLVGWVFDTTGSYFWGFFFVGLWTMIGGVVLLFLKKPKLAEEKRKLAVA